MGDEDNLTSGKVTEDFDFDEFYVEEKVDVSEGDMSDAEKVEGVFADDEAYDKILDLHGENSDIAVSAEYPYLRVSDILPVPDEINMFTTKLDRLKKSLDGSYSDEDMLNIVVKIGSEEYVVNRLPLILDTLLTIISTRKYTVSIIRGKDDEMVVNSDLMKALIFT